MTVIIKKFKFLQVQLKNNILKLIFIASFAILLSSCNSKNTGPYGILNDSFYPCSKEGICISSRNNIEDKPRYVEPIKFYETKKVAYEKINKLLLKYNAQIISKKSEYIHAKLTSSFGTERNAEFHFLQNENIVHMKMTTSSIWPDFGKTRNLLEEIKFKFFQHDIN